MKITKFAQSCLLIEVLDKKILIDPGVIKFKDSYLEDEWVSVDAVLVTHKHADHCHDVAIESILKSSGAKLYSSSEVAREFPHLPVSVVREGDVLFFDKLKVEVVRAVHGWIPKFKNGLAVTENIGFIIDDGVNRVYHTSDTICFDNDYKCDVVFLPVVNHGVVMGPWEAARFAKLVGARLAVPVHYDNPEHPADFDLVKKEFDASNLDYKLLNIEESINL